MIPLQQKAKMLEEIQKEIYDTIPQDSPLLLRNNVENQKKVRDILTSIVRKYEPKRFVVRCDPTNNTDMVVREKRFVASIYIKWDEDIRFSTIRFEKRPDPKETI